MSADNWAVCPKCKRDLNDETSQFREDYELGTLEDGEFYVIYHGKCENCGLTHEFKHSVNILKC